MAKKDKKTAGAGSDFNLQPLNTQRLIDHLRFTLEMGKSAYFGDKKVDAAIAAASDKKKARASKKSDENASEEESATAEDNTPVKAKTFGRKDINVAIFGRRGSGKTHICKEEIIRSGCKEVYLNLSTFERPDLSGYPKIFNLGRDEAYVDFFQPEFFRSLMEGNEPVVLLLDEVDKADPSIWAPLLEITQFRTINGRALPNLIVCLMTGNLISEGGNKPSPPLLDRAEKYLVEPSALDWLNWAGNAGVHPSVTALIQEKPEVLFGNVDMEDNYADPSPRGWERSSEIAKWGEEHNQESRLVTEKVSGCVGKEAGLHYQMYYEHYIQIIPLSNSIMEGKAEKKDLHGLDVTKRWVLWMSVANKLSTIMDKKTFSKEDKTKLNAAGKFMLENTDAENLLCIIRSQIGRERLMQKNPEMLQLMHQAGNPWAEIFKVFRDKVYQRKARV